MVKKDWWSQKFRKLVTLGESTTAGGWSTTPERCWASLLAELINDFQSRPVQLFNAGIGASVISTRSPGYPYSGKPAATERLEKHVIEQRPDLLIISYGLNDARGGTPLELFREELVTISATASLRCWRRIAPAWPSGRKSWNKRARAGAMSQPLRPITVIRPLGCTRTSASPLGSNSNEWSGCDRTGTNGR